MRILHAHTGVPTFITAAPVHIIPVVLNASAAVWAKCIYSIGPPIRSREMGLRLGLMGLRLHFLFEKRVCPTRTSDSTSKHFISSQYFSGVYFFFIRPPADGEK